MTPEQEERLAVAGYARHAHCWTKYPNGHPTPADAWRMHFFLVDDPRIAMACAMGGLHTARVRMPVVVEHIEAYEERLIRVFTSLPSRTQDESMDNIKLGLLGAGYERQGKEPFPIWRKEAHSFWADIVPSRVPRRASLMLDHADRVDCSASCTVPSKGILKYEEILRLAVCELKKPL